MAVRYPAAFKTHISTVLLYLLKKSLHEEYEIRLVFSQTPYDDDAGSLSYASIEACTVYLNAAITIYPCLLDAWKARDFERIGRSLCHEVSHLITWPLWDVAKDLLPPNPPKLQLRVLHDADERQTQRVRNIMASLLPPMWYSPRVLAAWAKKSA